MPRRPLSLTSDNSNNDRPEPRLIRAIEANNFAKVQAVLEDVQNSTISSPNLLSIGLVRACDRNSILIARYLLSYGANPNYVSGNKLSGLLRAAETGSAEVTQLLLEWNANLGVCDKKGRTSLMTAAWKGHLHVVKLLLTAGANIHEVDHRRRNVLHNLAADNARQRNTRMDVVDYLLQAGVNLDARDELGRTALHWTCVTDNEALMVKLLASRTSGGSPGAELNVVDARMKTPLHLAVAHGNEALAQRLLELGADVNAQSDGGWTALHNACVRGSAALIEALLKADADPNGKLVNGRTPLHVAAEAGNVEVVQRLMAQPKVLRASKDRFENTPLLMAAQRGHKEIAELLSPWNNLDLLTDDEITASKSFNATILDFGNFKNENKVTRRSVYDLLYARDDRDSSKHAISTLPGNVKASNFRWIHLPANDIAWAETLLMKRFIEEGSNDIDGYKALATSFVQQHRGQRYHSRFMRPSCQLLQKSNAPDEETIIPETAEPPSILVHEPMAMNGSTGQSDGSEGRKDKSNQSGGRKQTPKQRSSGSSTKVNMDPNAPGPTSPKSPRRNTRKESRGGGGRNTPNTKKGSGTSYNVYMFMPYLHFETDQNRKEMQKAVEHADELHLRSALIEDEVLIRAHLSKSTSFLHVRRTLDQFFYHNIDTEVRDCDQVVYRFQKKNRNEAEVDPKIFMVDQLWMWILGKDLVVTSFPQRWRQPRNDPLNVLDGVIEDINSKTREPVHNVYELAVTIAGRCFGSFDRHGKGDNEFQFFDMFEASIGNAMDLEATLFQDFSAASRQASRWLLHQQRPSKFTKHLEAASKAHQHAAAKTHPSSHPLDEDPHEPLFVDKLLDVGAETDLLAEIKDIRDELDIIQMILSSQSVLLPDLRDAIRSIYNDDHRLPTPHARRIDKSFDDLDKLIQNPLKDISRMDKQAERIYTSIRDLLDLKQKHANAFEARFARDQAAGTVRQGQTIMVFTIVTVIFLPLSFIAALFAINIESFPRGPDGNPRLSLSYVSAYTFGIGLAISIPCIIMALTVDELGYALSRAKRHAVATWTRFRYPHQDPILVQQTLHIDRALSRNKSVRRSLDPPRYPRLSTDVPSTRAAGAAPWTTTTVPSTAHPPPALYSRPVKQQLRATGEQHHATWDIERGG